MTEDLKSQLDYFKDEPEYLRKVIDELEQENRALRDNNNHLRAIIDDGRAENKRFREENKELKKTVENQKLEYEELQCDLSEVENACGCYQSENAELEQENKDLKKQIESDKGLITIGGKQQYDMTIAYDKCKTALEEIRKLIKSYELTVDNGASVDTIYKIRKIINEVLNE